ncbi:hypothetical protein R1sor_021519 [Riccia sorocarpa]|uniref:Uncharacterized protein n=1 Tax=Riccia sorocarpa TaxID=122646 RepID=A0ABD3GI18_9MARC
MVIYLGGPIGDEVNDQKIGFKELEKTIRTFLWGINAEGRPKKSLVIQRPNHEGGLGLGNFELQSETLKMRLMARIMSKEKVDWIQLLETSIQQHYEGWTNRFA